MCCAVFYVVESALVEEQMNLKIAAAKKIIFPSQELHVFFLISDYQNSTAFVLGEINVISPLRFSPDSYPRYSATSNYEKTKNCLRLADPESARETDIYRWHSRFSFACIGPTRLGLWYCTITSGSLLLSPKFRFYMSGKLHFSPRTRNPCSKS